MATTIENRDLVIIDKYKNFYVLYPTTNTLGVIVDPSINADIFDSTTNTLRDVLSKMGKLGFKNTILLDDIDPSVFLTDSDDEEESVVDKSRKIVTYKYIEDINAKLKDYDENIDNIPDIEDDITDIKKRLNKVEAVSTSIKTSGEGFSTVCPWYDGNPAGINRNYYFVTYTVDNSTEKMIKIAGKNDRVYGVSMPPNGVITNLTANSVNGEGALLDAYNAVTVVGPALVKDLGVCKPGDYCVCGADGVAEKSTSNIGYYVISRHDTSTILINMDSSIANAIQLQKNIDSLTEQITSMREELDNLPDITSGTSDPSGGKSGDVYIKYEAQ